MTSRWQDRAAQPVLCQMHCIIFFLLFFQSYCLLFIQGKAAFSGTYLKKSMHLRRRAAEHRSGLGEQGNWGANSFGRKVFGWKASRGEGGKRRAQEARTRWKDRDRQDLRAYSHHSSWVAVNNNMSILAQQSISLLHLTCLAGCSVCSVGVTWIVSALQSETKAFRMVQKVREEQRNAFKPDEK